MSLLILWFMKALRLRLKCTPVSEWTICSLRGVISLHTTHTCFSNSVTDSKLRWTPHFITFLFGNRINIAMIECCLPSVVLVPTQCVGVKFCSLSPCKDLLPLLTGCVPLVVGVCVFYLLQFSSLNTVHYDGAKLYHAVCPLSSFFHSRHIGLS